MVLANVAAAEELERLHRPCVYRGSTHRRRMKNLTALRGFLSGLGISLPPGNQIHPRDLDRVLRKVAGTQDAQVVNEVMLRSQSQAAYSPDNIGHFGLGTLDPLRAFHQSDPPLCRSSRASFADRAGLKLGPGRGLADHEAALLPRHRYPHHRDRTARGDGRAGRDRPVSRRVHG